MKENVTPAQKVANHDQGAFGEGELESSVSQGPGFAASPDSGQILQHQLAANASAQVGQLRSLQQAANASPQVRQAAQLQRAADSLSAAPIQRKQNNTGMPDNLKSGIEALSGFDLSDVQVHYNSSKPAALHAHAYAEGNEIHVAPGQEKHLAHEAWHIVQQRQGRVKATTSVGDHAVNDDAGLEREADIMGAKALQTKADPGISLKAGATPVTSAQLVAQLLNKGTATMNKDNREEAIGELVEIGEASDINSAMELVEERVSGTLERYKEEFESYIESKDNGDQFQWAWTYISGRASRKSGRLSETNAIQDAYGIDAVRNNKTYYVKFHDLYEEPKVAMVIPDYVSGGVVADVKDVKYQSFTQQLEALYAIAKGKDSRGGKVEVKQGGNKVNSFGKSFELMVRGPMKSKSRTGLSSQLYAALDVIHYVIE